jgi:hypothetical protein
MKFTERRESQARKIGRSFNALVFLHVNATTVFSGSPAAGIGERRGYQATLPKIHCGG